VSGSCSASGSRPDVSGSRSATGSRLDVSGSRSAPLLRVTDLRKLYPVRGSKDVVRAVDGVSFDLHRGETLGIVGESGCGKSTTARLIVRLEDPTAGAIALDGQDLALLRGRELRAARRRIQLVFQDPQASLNPRSDVGRTLHEVLAVHRIGADAAARRARVRELLDMVGLSAAHADRYPHELSGGQRQRVGIARALAVEPDVVVLDEPVSALDVSVQSEVMNLLTTLRRELGLSYVFISHDLGMVRHVSDRIAVMYLGRIVELGPWKPVSDEPLHPYTRALQEAVPVPDPAAEARRDVAPLRGEVPDPAHPPPGCSFHPRCPLAEQRCIDDDPALEELAPRHHAACHAAAGRLEGAPLPWDARVDPSGAHRAR
jgi:oligopeptide/dipeptide ABC transporter ATP-binding protein